MTDSAWSLLMTTPAPGFAPLSSRLIRWRSTRICFSSSVSSPIPMLSERFIGPVADSAVRQVSKISLRCAGFAQPGKGVPTRLRASRTRVIRTIAVLLPAESVSSEGVSISEEMVMGGLARGLGCKTLFDLVDFIAGAGGVFVTLGLDCLVEVEFELREPVV